MSKNKHPPFVMVTNQVLDSPAWCVMSTGARCLYIALKRRYIPNSRNNGRIYLSQREARKQIGSSPNEIARWFRELQHYGFIIMMEGGSLGVDGKGKAPRWRLTEVAYMRGSSSKGMNDMPTMDFLKWNGKLFSKHQTGGDHLKPKTESRYGKPLHPVTENRNTSVTENRNTSWNNRYGKPVHIASPTVTENRNSSYKPSGVGREGSITGPEQTPEQPSNPTRRGRDRTNGRDGGHTPTMTPADAAAQQCPICGFARVPATPEATHIAAPSLQPEEAS
jgi:hypothetical protein